MALDFSKPITTRDGRAVTIYCTDAPGDYPVHGLINGDILPSGWMFDGAAFGDTPNKEDLVNTPEPKREGWVNVYFVESELRTGAVYPTHDECKKNAGTSGNCVARYHVVEGQFDEA